MPRGYRSDTIAVGAGVAQTIVFNSNLLPQGGIKDFYVLTTGANNSLDSAIIQVVVKLEGVEVVNVTGAQMRVLQEALFPNNTIVGAGVLRFTIPMSFPWTMSGIWPLPGLVSGIPFGLNVSVEISTDATASAGSMQIGWTTLDTPPAYMLKCVKQATGVGLNTVAPVSINYGMNDILGFLLTNGANKITKLRFVSRLADGREYQVTDLSNLMLLQSQAGLNPLTVTDPYLYMFEKPYKFGQNSYVEYTTGAGGLVTDTFGAVQVVDVRPAQA